MYLDEGKINRIKDLYLIKQYGIEQIADKLGISFWSLYNFMAKNNIPRRSQSETNYLMNKSKPKFKLKVELNYQEERLKVAGIMLYWAEGTLKGKTVDFANSNPEMIELFLRFLRNICGVNEKRLRVYFYGYSYQNLKFMTDYWHKVTGIPLSQFTRPYIRQGNPNITNRKLPYGMVHIRYNDKKLLTTIENWIKEYKDSVLIWAGTQVAKGGRLSKGSVLPKGRMEK